MEVRTEPWPSRRGNGPHPVGWPVQRIHSLACEAAAPVCFGQGFASLASGVPWNRCQCPYCEQWQSPIVTRAMPEFRQHKHRQYDRRTDEDLPWQKDPCGKQ